MGYLAVPLGLIAVLAGAEAFVRGASALARRLHVSALLIGLTVVAFGTSAPELAVSVQAALIGDPGIAVANVAGSNIFNLLVILGLSAALVPLVVHQQLVRLDVPLLVGASFLVLWLAGDGTVSRAEGAALVAGAVAYTALLVVLSRRETQALRQEHERSLDPAVAGRRLPVLVDVVRIAIGLLLLVVGARWLVGGSAELAARLGVPSTVIGLTIVAAGTSLPELATSVVAGLRGERDIAAGNAIGSSLFNLLFVLGAAAAIAPRGMAVSEDLIAFELPLMTAAAVACLPIFFTGHRISRWEGVAFLGAYAAYVVDVVLAATGHPWVHTYRVGLAVFVVPLLVLTLAVYVGRRLALRRARSAERGR